MDEATLGRVIQHYQTLLAQTTEQLVVARVDAERCRAEMEAVRAATDEGGDG